MRMRQCSGGEKPLIMEMLIGRDYVAFGVDRHPSRSVHPQICVGSEAAALPQACRRINAA
jgi:hypothetical protein